MNINFGPISFVEIDQQITEEQEKLQSKITDILEQQLISDCRYRMKKVIIRNSIESLLNELHFSEEILISNRLIEQRHAERQLTRLRCVERELADLKIITMQHISREQELQTINNELTTQIINAIDLHLNQTPQEPLLENQLTNLNQDSNEYIFNPISLTLRQFEYLETDNYNEIKKKLENLNMRIDTTCAICHSDFDIESSTNITNVLCTDNHLFHTECVKPWLTRMSYKCPSCRQDLITIA